MSKLTLACAHSLVLAVVCALMLPACGGGSSPTPGSGGNGGGATGGTGGGQTTDARFDAGSDAMVAQDVGGKSDAQTMPDVGGQDDTARDGSAGDVLSNPDGSMLNASVVQMMRRVADWQLARATADMTNLKDWIRGVMWLGIMSTYKTTRDEKYMTALRTWAGAGWTLNGGAAARGDNQTPAQTFFDAYLLDPIPANMVRLTARNSFDPLVANTPQGRVEWWWEDALFMVGPAFARLGAATGNRQYFTTLNAMYWDTYAFLWSPANGLMYRDVRLGNNTVFWSRGNGWVIASVPRILDYLPQDDPKRPDYITLFTTMAASLARLQGADGLWRTNLLNVAQFPGPETSGTALMTYAMAWGLNNGILDRATYLGVVQKGWDGLLANVDAAGKLGYVQPEGVAPGVAAADSTTPFGVGVFLLAASEMAKLLP